MLEEDLMMRKTPPLWQESVFIRGPLIGKRLWLNPEPPQGILSYTVYPKRSKHSREILAYQTYISGGTNTHRRLYVAREDVELLSRFERSFTVSLLEWIAHPGIRILKKSEL